MYKVRTAPQPTSRNVDWPAWVSDPKTLLGLPGAFGLGFLLKRYFDRRDKRSNAALSLKFHLRNLEKRFIIAYRHPGFDSGQDDFAVFTNDLREAVLGSAGLFGSKGEVVLAALQSCTSEGAYLSTQRNRELTIQSEPQMKASARRALLTIYGARDALHDRDVLVWQPDPENRGLWTPGAPIERIQ